MVKEIAIVIGGAVGRVNRSSNHSSDRNGDDDSVGGGELSLTFEPHLLLRHSNTQYSNGHTPQAPPQMQASPQPQQQVCGIRATDPGFRIGCGKGKVGVG